MESDLFLSQLKASYSKGLPGEKAHLKALPVNRPLSSEAKVKAKNEYRTSAVSILLHPSQSSIECVLIQRPDYQGTHGGQVSFPGGKMEEFDKDLIDTARRECHEEIGFPAQKGELIGAMTEVFIPVSKFVVQPYLFFENSTPEFTPDAREVKEILSFDVIQFANQEIEYTSITAKSGIRLKDVPFYNINDRIVWGATAIMLAEFQEILRRFC